MSVGGFGLSVYHRLLGLIGPVSPPVPVFRASHGRRALYAGASLLALIATAPDARADCAPDPAESGGTVYCTGAGVTVNDTDLTTIDMPAMLIGPDGFDATLQNNADISASGQFDIFPPYSGAVLLNIGANLINTGTVRGEGEGFSAIIALQNARSKITNSGQIISDQAPAITSEAESYRAINLLNLAGGTITGGGGIAIQGRGGIIENAGTIVGSVVLTGNDNIYTTKAGGILQGDLTFSGDNNIFKVDYSLLNTGRGVTGVVDPGPGSSNKLEILISGTKNLTLPDLGGFDRFGIETIDPEAVITFATSNDTITQTLEVTGPGTVVNPASLVIDDVTGRFASAAAYIRNEGNTGPSAGPRSNFINQGPVSASAGIGISSYGAVTIQNSAAISVSNDAIGIYSDVGGYDYGGLVINTGTITGADAASVGVKLRGTSVLYNQNVIQSEGTAIYAYHGGTVHNSGSITSDETAVLGTDGFFPLAIRNEASGTISGTDYAVQCNDCTTIIYNAGNIDGDIDVKSGTNYFVSAGGTLNGTADFSSSDNIFLAQQNTGAAFSDFDSFNKTNSHNIIGWAVEGEGIVTLAPVEGYSGMAVGTINSESTAIIAPGTQNLAEPVLLVGGGTFINQSDLNNNDGYALQSYSYSSAIINNGTITGQDGIHSVLGARHIQNTGLIETNGFGIRLELDYSGLEDDDPGFGVGIGFSVMGIDASGPQITTSSQDENSAPPPWVTITNSGTIRINEADNQSGISVGRNRFNNPYNGPNIDLSTDLPRTFPLILPDADYTSVLINNTGTIETSSSGEGIKALSGSNIRISNSGTITTNHFFTPAVLIASEYGSVNNTGLIRSSGQISTAVSLVGEAQMSLTNSGTITATGGGQQREIMDNRWELVDGELVPIPLPTVITTRAAPTAVLEDGTITNTATGIISATGLASVALQLTDRDTETVIVENAGLITGDAGGIYPVEMDENGVQGYMYIPGAILGGAGQEIILNTGTIEGGIVLGGGNDSFTQLSGGIVTGIVDGGEGTDTLTLEIMEGTDLRASDIATQFLNFESFSTLGTGNLVLDANPGGGTPTFNNGLIRIDNVYNGDIILGAAARLGGNGRISGSVTTSGTVGAGNSIGTLTIGGDLVLDENSTLEVEFNTNAADLVIVEGSTTLQGGTIAFIPDGENVFGVFSHEVLRTEDGITGTFNTQVAPNYALVSLRFEGDSLFADFVTQLGAGVTLSPQSVLVADYLNGAVTTGAGAATLSAFTDLAGLDPTAELSAALAQLHPEAYASGPVSLGLAGALATGGVLSDRLDPAQGMPDGRHWQLWAEGIGSYGSQNAAASGGLSGFDTNLHGLLAGIDLGVAKDARLGAFVGYNDANQQFDSLLARNDYSSVVIGGYATHYAGPLTLGAMAAYSDGKIDTRRSITNSAFAGTTRAEYDLQTIMARSEVRYTLALSNSTTIEPGASVNYIHIERGAATETGLAGVNLAVDARTVEALVLDLGARLANTWQTGDIRLTAEASGGWRYDMINDDRFAAGRLAGAGTSSMIVAGVPNDRSQALVAAGLTAHWGTGLVLFAKYEGTFGDDTRTHTGRVGASWAF